MTGLCWMAYMATETSVDVGLLVIIAVGAGMVAVAGGLAWWLYKDIKREGW